MYFVVGIFLALLILIVVIWGLGIPGLLAMFIFTFAFIYIIYRQNKQLLDDVKKIREHLGLLTEAELQADKEIKYRQEYEHAQRDTLFMSEMNEQIEKELDQPISAPDGEISKSDDEKS